MKKTNQKRGVALLTAILLGGFVMMIAISVYKIALISFKLSRVSRQGQIAFYNADALSECVLYHDSTGGGLESKKGHTINCFGKNSSSNVTGSGAPSNANYTVDFLTGTEPCGQVRVVRTNGKSKLSALGYDTCGAHKAERLIILDY